MARVLLTGASGFVGSHLARRLLAQGWEVAALVRPQSNPWRISDILPRLRVITGDLNDVPALAIEIKTFAPQVTLHLGWQGVGSRLRNDAQQTANLGATLKLLDAVQAAGCGVWVGLGSQAEYGIRDAATSEQTPTEPVTLYGVTKLCAGWLTRQLCAQYGLRYVWLRLFSSYGPADDAHWMIPYVILALARGETPALTDGAQQWDYVYVSDVVDAICLAAQDERANGVYNLGSGETRTIRHVVESIRDLMDRQRALGFGQVPYRPDQIMHLKADVSRLKALGWSPQVTLDEGLRSTVDWFLANMKYYA